MNLTKNKKEEDKHGNADVEGVSICPKDRETVAITYKGCTVLKVLWNFCIL